MNVTLEELLPSLQTWVLTDGKAGHENQSLGVAEALGISPQIIQLEKCYLGDIRAFFYPPARVKTLPSPPWPDIVIATGNLTADVARWIKMNNPNVFLIQMMHPTGNLSFFDVIASPLHDKSKPANNIVKTLGVPNRITMDLLKEAKDKWGDKLKSSKPLLAVIVGGKSKKFSFTLAQARRFAYMVKQFANMQGYNLLVTTSRRTGKEQTAILQDILGGSDTFFFDGVSDGDNPFLGYLALADAAVVTADSVSMISESSAAGLPVYLYGLEGEMGTKNFGKFKYFYDALIKAGRATSLGGEVLSAPEFPLNDTQAVAGFVRAKLLQKFGE